MGLRDLVLEVPVVVGAVPELPGIDRNVKRFRGGLVFKAHRLSYHSTLGLRVSKKKKKKEETTPPQLLTLLQPFPGEVGKERREGAEETVKFATRIGKSSCLLQLELASVLGK